jgi:hypothetical protein
MPIVNIEPRETQKLVDTGGRWYVEAVNQTVLLNNAATRVKDSGRELDDGAKAHVDLERFGERTLYAFNPSKQKTAQVRVDRQNFELNLFPRRTTENPSDSAARISEDGEFTQVGVTISAGGFETVIDKTNTGDETLFIPQTSVRRTTAVDPINVSYQFRTLDDTDTEQRKVYFNPYSGYAPLEPVARLEPGWTAELAVENMSGSPHDFNGMFSYRGGELP